MSGPTITIPLGKYIKMQESILSVHAFCRGESNRIYLMHNADERWLGYREACEQVLGIIEEIESEQS